MPVVGLPKPPVPLRRVFKSYAKEAKLSHGTVKRWSPVIDRLIARLGHEDAAAIQPADIHDATWGVVSAVYGGAIHPSAEGHAAMADAALPAACRRLWCEILPLHCHPPPCASARAA